MCSCLGRNLKDQQLEERNPFEEQGTDDEKTFGLRVVVFFGGIEQPPLFTLWRHLVNLH